MRSTPHDRAFLSAIAPGTLAVTAGETITFRFRNAGTVVHEALIGDDATQAEHATAMAEKADGHDHDHSGALTVAPGATAELTKTFATAGTLVLADGSPLTCSAEVEPAVGEADLDGQPRPRPSVAIGEDRVGAHVVAGLTDARSLEEVGDVQVVVVELGRHPRLGRHGACLPGGLTRLRRRAHRRR